jgi:capsular exopolysaccharide synthesis family protein
MAINTAIAFGKLHKTLLIDCDLRRPSIDKLVSNNEKNRHLGLSDLCLGEVKFSECIHKMKDAKIDVLCAGTINPNPQELFCSTRFTHVLNSLSEVYDVIVIDTPPSLGLSDTSLIASHVNQLVFVVKSGITSVAKVRASWNSLKKVNAPIAGVVVNQVMPDDLHDSYYYEYGYGVDSDVATDKS